MRRDDFIAGRGSTSYEEVLEDCGLWPTMDDSKRDHIAEIGDTGTYDDSADDGSDYRSLPDTANWYFVWSPTPLNAQSSVNDPRQVTAPDSVAGSWFFEDEWQSPQPGANTQNPLVPATQLLIYHQSFQRPYSFNPPQSEGRSWDQRNQYGSPNGSGGSSSISSMSDDSVIIELLTEEYETGEELESFDPEVLKLCKMQFIWD